MTSALCSAIHDFGSVRVRTPYAQAGQRIGIMGGSFNPPHDGHRIVAETALKRLRLDQLWWVVTPGNPLKSKSGLPSAAHRIGAAREFARGPRMKLTAFEQELGTPYTAATLAFLKRRHARVHFVWIMGADNLAHFDRWQHWRSIAAGFPLAIVDRPGWRFKALSGRAAQSLQASRCREPDAALLSRRPAPSWMFLTARLSPLSSSDLRERAARHKT